MVFLFLYTQSPQGSVIRPTAMVLALYFLAISGIRFVLLTGRKAG
jgi:hypothetical protein